MFTGLIEEIGTLVNYKMEKRGAKLWIQSPKILSDLKVGDSIAVNGCCLTCTEIFDDTWTAEAVPETLKKTNLKFLAAGSEVNLERALRVGDRMGGHIVQGHIDDVGTFVEKTAEKDGSWRVKIKCSAQIASYIVQRGSIAVDGVSLTVIDVQKTSFTFAMIPHTAKVTTLGKKEKNAIVNLEIDLLAKYLEKLAKGFSYGSN